jgi:hypothetical protein
MKAKFESIKIIDYKFETPENVQDVEELIGSLL